MYDIFLEPWWSPGLAAQGQERPGPVGVAHPILSQTGLDCVF